MREYEGIQNTSALKNKTAGSYITPVLRFNDGKLRLRHPMSLLRIWPSQVRFFTRKLNDISRRSHPSHWKLYT